MNRFFTAPKLADAYRLPKHVLEQLLAEVAPVEKNDLGEPLYQEAHVDGWLTARYSMAPWRSACLGPTAQVKPTEKEESNSFVTVAEAQRRFLAGKMSRRWWYRMASTGKLAHG